METGRISANQELGLAAYQGRMVAEVLTCVNNLHNRCDKIADGTAILGCAAFCSGLHSTDNGSLLQNSVLEGYSYPDGLGSAVGGQSFLEIKESSQVGSSQYQTLNTPSQELPLESDRKCLRKGTYGVVEVETTKKKRKMAHTERISRAVDESQVSVNMSENALHIPAQGQGEAAKARIMRLQKGKDALIVVKSAEQSLLSRAAPPSFVDEGIDKEEAAVEWQQCVSLLKSYGILRNPEFLTQTVPHCVPHPGYVGDGLLPKLCKTCGTLEEPNNTVICDDCQEAFHLSCCFPRMSSKYFKREDYWFCISCKKQKKMDSKLTERSSSQGNCSSVGFSCHVSKARLGPAHQTDVPLWQGRVEGDDLERRAVGCIGMEIPLLQEQKDAEKDYLLKTFEDKVKSLCWLPAERLPNGMLENWLKCNNVVAEAFKDSDGRKHNQVVCGKWRRAPLNVEQSDDWECFCAMEWDPLHADCAIPQERSTEEISIRMQANSDSQGSEALHRKTTLRRGKCAP